MATPVQSPDRNETRRLDAAAKLVIDAGLKASFEDLSISVAKGKVLFLLTRVSFCSFITGSSVFDYRVESTNLVRFL